MLDFGLALAYPVAMTIAGSDPSGGAGLQADLKTFHEFGVYGTAVATIVTAQNTCSVDAIAPLDPALVRMQLNAVQRDIPPSAAKTGALGDPAIVEVVADWAQHFDGPLVVDPVAVSQHGARLARAGALEVIIGKLLPNCFLAMPNLHEAGILTALEVRDLATMRQAAQRIAALGARHVLVKGGHLQGDAIDLLWTGGDARTYRSPRIATRETHGTGCTYSAAITALLALGRSLPEAVGEAKQFITEAIRTAPGLGRGPGPVNHHASIRSRKA